MDNDDFHSTTSSFRTNDDFNNLSTPMNPNNQRNTINNLPVVTLGGQDESSFNQSSNTTPSSSNNNIGNSSNQQSIFSSFRLRNNNNNSSSNNNNNNRNSRNIRTNNSSNSNNNNEKDVHIEGFLQKQGKIVKSWKRRYFVFHDESELTYYTDEKKKKKKGSLNIDKSIIVECFNEFKNEFNIFKIVTKKRVLYLKTNNSDEMFKWIDKFKEVNQSIQFLDVLPTSNEMTEASSDDDDDDDQDDDQDGGDDQDDEDDRLTDENMSTMSSIPDILDASSKNYNSNAIVMNNRQSVRNGMDIAQQLSSLMKYNSNNNNENNDDEVDMNVLKDEQLAREESQYLGQRQVYDHYDDDDDEDEVKVVVKSTKKSINQLPGKSSSFSALSTSTTRKMNSFSSSKKEETSEQSLVIDDITSFFIMSTEKNENSNVNNNQDFEQRSNSINSTQRKKIQLLAPIEKTNPLDKAFQDLHSNNNNNSNNQSLMSDISMLVVKQNFQSSIKEKAFNEYYQSISQEQSIHPNNHHSNHSNIRSQHLTSSNSIFGGWWRWRWCWWRWNSNSSTSLLNIENDNSDSEDSNEFDENDWLMRKSEPMSSLIVHPSFKEYSHGITDITNIVMEGVKLTSDSTIEYNRMIAHILHQRYQDEETFQKGKGNPDIPIDTILQQYVQINGNGNE
ncbi:predicted protein [Naegleria gruberi]|uniref:Predicted protein n=1 Tax=Naegleria gruberi TaxID=5762 RepID=D2VFS6_NAEGR|nr:uncharacterized protein NAEGRDRAFT_67728 [Naegleria gruberi]EFC44523.1 predicted protein [Naegleria gruberi]|eukprot:XP_002677267.1 predicted protein [Naegleria gruberi strain NEG-M]